MRLVTEASNNPLMQEKKENVHHSNGEQNNNINRHKLLASGFTKTKTFCKILSLRLFLFTLHYWDLCLYNIALALHAKGMLFISLDAGMEEPFDD